MPFANNNFEERKAAFSLSLSNIWFMYNFVLPKRRLFNVLIIQSIVLSPLPEANLFSLKTVYLNAFLSFLKHQAF